MTSILFQPFCLHDLTLRNRIVLAPMTRASPYFSPRGGLAGVFGLRRGWLTGGHRCWRRVGASRGCPSRFSAVSVARRAASTAARSVRGRSGVAMSISAGWTGTHPAQIVVHGREQGLIGIRLRE
jgi:hypothetical protein